MAQEEDDELLELAMALVQRGASSHMNHAELAIATMGKLGVHVMCTNPTKRAECMYTTTKDFVWVCGPEATSMLMVHLSGSVRDHVSELLHQLVDTGKLDEDSDKTTSRILACYANETSMKSILSCVATIQHNKYKKEDFEDALDADKNIFSLQDENIVDFKNNGEKRKRRFDDFITKRGGFTTVDTNSEEYMTGVKFWTEIMVKQLDPGLGPTWLLIHLGYCMTGYTSEKCFCFIKGETLVYVHETLVHVQRTTNITLFQLFYRSKKHRQVNAQVRNMAKSVCRPFVQNYFHTYVQNCATPCIWRLPCRVTPQGF